MNRRHVPVWTVLGVVLVVALLFGGGVFSSPRPTDAQRATAIESVVRCPSCEDLSVAVSSAPTAVTVRATVAHLIAQGKSDQQIKEFLVTRYGSAIVLDPSTTGWSALVWALPVVVGLLGAAGLVIVFVRRRSDQDLDADVRGGSVAPEVVDERRQFLTQSLADADAEYLAGDLSDADYLALRKRDVGRLVALDAPSTASSPSGVPVVTVTDSPVAAGGWSDGPEPASMAGEAPATARTTAAPVAAPTRRRRRNARFLAAAIGCFAVALVVAVPLFATNRLPGQTATGSVSLSASQQLARSLDQAATAENQGQLGVAAQIYQSVLAAHPEDEVALAQFGWLEYRIGQQGSSATLLADARTKLNQAVELAPGDYAAHLYLGTFLLQQDANAAGAADQFTLFLAAHPPTAVLDQAASTVRTAFTDAGEPLPAGVPTGASPGIPNG